MIQIILKFNDLMSNIPIIFVMNYFQIILKQMLRIPNTLITLINYRSLRCNIDIILIFITENYMYIAFKETWLNDDDHHILSLLN